MTVVAKSNLTDMQKMPTPTDPVLYQQIVDQVKKRVNRWPSAYASGMVVQQYKKEMEKIGKEAYTEQKESKQTDSPLARWFEEKWIDILTGKPCGAVRSDTYYPTCRPSVRVTEKTPVTSSQLTPKQQANMILVKQGAKNKRVAYKETHRRP